jgi:hypothetical protein
MIGGLDCAAFFFVLLSCRVGCLLTGLLAERLVLQPGGLQQQPGGLQQGKISASVFHCTVLLLSIAAKHFLHHIPSIIISLAIVILTLFLFLLRFLDSGFDSIVCGLPSFLYLSLFLLSYANYPSPALPRWVGSLLIPLPDRHPDSQLR